MEWRDAGEDDRPARDLDVTLALAWREVVLHGPIRAVLGQAEAGDLWTGRLDAHEGIEVTFGEMAPGVFLFEGRRGGIVRVMETDLANFAASQHRALAWLYEEGRRVEDAGRAGTDRGRHQQSLRPGRGLFTGRRRDQH